MTVLAIQYLPHARLRPNPWNPNVMTEEMLQKEIASIETFGFVDPLTVRRLGRDWQIIDGEHRWIAAGRMGLDQIPCIVVDVDDETAQQLTIVLNDLRGKPDPERLASLVREIGQRRDSSELEKVLPYKRQQLMEMLADRKESVDWEALNAPKEKGSERWVERVYRLPIGAAEVIDQAIAKARESDAEFDWQALELICADYMAG